MHIDNMYNKHIYICPVTVKLCTCLFSLCWPYSIHLCYYAQAKSMVKMPYENIIISYTKRDDTLSTLLFAYIFPILPTIIFQSIYIFSHMYAFCFIYFTRKFSVFSIIYLKYFNFIPCPSNTKRIKRVLSRLK